MKGNFEALIESDKPVIVDFFAEWCSPCKMQAPILKELAAALGESVRILKVDVDKNPQVVSRYQVRSVPTMMIFQRGQVRWRQTGVQPKHTILDALKQLQ